MAETITLSGVPETMLQTVYARAKESRRRGAIRDLKAEEIIGRLGYDFSLADKDAAMHSGVIARTIVLDRLVGEYLAAHPGATVMNLACGLDTRCYRMQGYAHWYNLDLPETIAVREALLPESGSISQLAMSAMDDWGAAVEGPSGPELCPCFCDSDDITYNDLHSDLLWRRTRTLGRGNDCCDFCLKLR